MSFIQMSLLFYLGCCAASFLVLVGMRVPRHESIVRPPSHCESCHVRLSARELFPVFSFALQKGRCRHCGTRLSAWYVVMELAGGATFLVAVNLFGKDFHTGALLFLLWSFGIIFTVSDIHYLLLPDSVMQVFFLSVFLLRLAADSSSVLHYLLSGAAVFALLLVLHLVYPDGLGGGDVKLFGVLGLLLGFQSALAAMFLSSFSALVYGLLHRQKQSAPTSHRIPFAPFIFLGSTAAALINFLYY